MLDPQRLGTARVDLAGGVQIGAAIVLRD